MSSVDPTQFNDEDQFNPVYCLQCKKHTPRALLTAGGLCPSCSEQMTRAQAVQPPGTQFGQTLPPAPGQAAAGYGGRAIDQLPPELAYTVQQQGASATDTSGWNWGAFFLTWIWAIGHNLWGWAAAAFFLGCIPFLFNIILGVKGNELAWSSRSWRSVEDFRNTQKIWAIVGVVWFSIQIVVAFVQIAAILGAAHSGTPGAPVGLN